MPDYTRLARAIQERTHALGWKQRDLIQRTHISRGTIQTLWKGVDVPEPNAATKIALEELLGWEKGSVDAVLAGNVPTPRRELADKSSDPVADAVASATASASSELPVPIQLMLEDGRVVDYDLITFPGDDEPTAFIGLAYPSSYDTEDKRAELRRRLSEFRRVADKVRREVDDPNTAPDAQD